MIPTVNPGVFFRTTRTLPRGRHKLERTEVIAIQRERTMPALVELMAARGYHGFGVGDIAARAGVSRGTFYDCFESKEACTFAAYDRCTGTVLGWLGHSTAAAQSWEESVTRLLEAYVESVRLDFVVARAFQVEIDAMGPPARHRRRETLRRFADHVRAEHQRFAATDPTLQTQADEAYLAAVHATRQITADLLDTEPEPDLSPLVDQLAPWLAHSFHTD